MAIDLSELTCELEEDGVKVVEELDKRILSKGTWVTVIYKMREWDRSSNNYGPPKYSLRRYQKVGDSYRQRAKFNISSHDQARQLIAVLQEWLNKDLPSNEAEASQL